MLLELSKAFHHLATQRPQADTQPDEFLVRQPVGALAAEAQGRVHVLQHVVHLRIVDPAPGGRGAGEDKLVVFHQEKEGEEV